MCQLRRYAFFKSGILLEKLELPWGAKTFAFLMYIIHIYSFMLHSHPRLSGTAELSRPRSPLCRAYSQPTAPKCRSNSWERRKTKSLSENAVLLISCVNNSSDFR